MSGILGKKLGMTQVFAGEDKKMVPVTAIEAGPCPILAVTDKHLQIAFGPTAEKRLKKPQAKYFAKLNIAAHKIIKDVMKESGKEYKVGEEVKVDLFKAGDFVDITGTSLGKGFQGGMKRWNWHGGPQTHGSMSHRRIGSLGSSTTPGRVWKGHHLPGHMGAHRVTVQNLEVIKVDAQNNLLLVKGAVPGYKNNYLIINKAKKRKPRVAVNTTAKAATKNKK